MRTFKPYNPDQMYLLPPSVREWLPDDHLALFVMDVMSALDLSAIYAEYERGDGRGQPPFHPQMMTSLLLYGYCTGKVSSRKLELATYEEVPFRVLAGGQHPDHDSIAAFRQRHLAALAGLFVQVLRLCQKAGLVKLGHVALDGTKLAANASKHKAMSYGRMAEAEARLVAEVEALLTEAARVDAEEDAKYGPGKRADELPLELRRRESRLAKIREAQAALEAEATALAEAEVVATRAQLAERARREEETGRKPGGRPPVAPDPAQARPEPKAQRNFTDPESRIMKDGASKAFVQAYNAQLAVDDAAQVIVAADVTQQANDKRQLLPLLEQVQTNTGALPAKASADAGYFSEANLSDERFAAVDLYIPPERQKPGAQALEPALEAAEAETAKARMRQKLKTTEGRAVYKMRKAIVEPVFGQTKAARGLRRFSFRGLAKVSAEWDLMCLSHNLLKLFRSGWQPGGDVAFAAAG